MLEDITRRIVEFRDARDWKQFHSPKNLAASISIEASELLETLQWSSDETIAADVVKRRADIEAELADVMVYCLLLAHDLEIDPAKAILAKLEENERKYPADRARGRSDKYTHL